MHACGHDAHTAILLATAIIINKIKNKHDGTFMYIFQPSEETFPGGAITMINNGIFNDIKPKAILALHVMPNMESGTIGIKDGPYMAATDEIYIEISGKGGHAATPELNIDPIYIAANIIMSLQSIVSRLSNPTIPVVLSFGKIIGNGRTNIVPDNVFIEGTLRTMDETFRYYAHKKISEIATNIAHSYNAKIKINIHKGYPALINNPKYTKFIEKHTKYLLGENNVITLQPRMTAEDFAYFAQIIPACLFRLGISNNNKYLHNLHSPYFDIDEQSLKTGIMTMSYLAIKTLEEYF